MTTAIARIISEVEMAATPPPDELLLPLPVDLRIYLGQMVCDQRGECRDFAVNLDDARFCASFEVLCRAAAGVGPLERVEYSRFPPPTPPNVHMYTAADTGREHWFARGLLGRQEYVPWHQTSHTLGWPLDACIVAETAMAVPEPSAVREARRLALRVSQPREHARTRIGMPAVTHAVCRRWLRFCEAPAWRLVCAQDTRTTLQALHTGVGDEMQHAMQLSAPTHEMSLQYIPNVRNVRGADVDDASSQEEGQVVVPRVTWTPAQAADQAAWLVGRLANCLGSTPAAVQRRLADDQHQAEMAACDV